MFRIKGLMTVLLAAVVFFQMGPAHAYLGVKSSQTEEKISKAGASLAPAAALGLPFLGSGGSAAAGGSLVWILGIGAAVVAVVAVFLILDEDGTSHIYYQTLNVEDALALGLTVEEAKAFNENVDMVNAVMDELRWADSQDYEGAWSYYADELGWNQTLRAAISKMSFHLHQSLTN